MQLIFRYDDFGFDFGRSYAVHEQLFYLFLSLDMPIVVGVIPKSSAEVSNPQNRIFYPIENDARSVHLLTGALQKGFQLALHGLTHQTYRHGARSEYANQPYRSQLTSIKNGMIHLSRIFPNTLAEIFIPPWDSFDPLTVDAVAAAGMRVLCGGGNIRPYDQNRVLVVPSSTVKGLINYVRYYSLDDLADLVGKSFLVITMHSYDFAGADALSLDEFGGLLHAIREKKIGVEVFPIGAQSISFIPKNEHLIRARLDLFCKGSTRFGSPILRAGHTMKRFFGASVGERTLDTAAYGLEILKAIHSHVRGKKNSRRIIDTCL
jgi:hypothetical protein